VPTPASIGAVTAQNFEPLRQSYTKNVRIKATETNYDEAGRKVSATTTHYAATNERFLLKQFDAGTGVQRPDIWLGTDRAIYRIKAKPDGNAHIITSRIPNTRASFFSVCRTETGVSLPLAMMEVTVVDYLKLPDLTVEKVSRIKDADITVDEVTTYRKLRGGIRDVFRLDAARNWRLISNEMTYVNNNTRAVVETTYRDDIPTRWEHKTIPPAGQPRTSTLVEINDFVRGGVTEQEMAFGQFGLPEPVGSRKPAGGMTTTFMWLLGGAGVCGVAFVIFRWLQTRRGGSQ
jgi:hypothetical protein